MTLPTNKNLPVNTLAACFNNTVATYKFYWFLSILQAVEDGLIIIPKTDLFSRMISNAWYTVNYFHISFGKQDKLQIAIENLKNTEKLPIDYTREKIHSHLVHSSKKESLNQLWHFNNQVPHWFLSPWFPQQNRTEIYKLSQEFENKCLYALHDDEIEINQIWLHI